MKTLRLPRLARAIVPAVLLVSAHSAFAATVTWTSANITDDNDVIAGTPYVAVNIGGSTGGDFTFGPGVTTTVHGVQFDGVYLNTLNTGTIADSTLVQFSSRTNNSGGAGLRVSFTNATTFGTGSAFSALSANYQALLGSGAYSTSSTDNTTLTFSGLTIGTTYQFQWWTNDSRALAADRTVTATAGNAITLESNTSSDTGLGQYAVGSFTADATTQAFNFTGSDGVQINGFQLTASAIPEPSTYAALTGLAALGIVVRRRRRAS